MLDQDSSVSSCSLSEYLAVVSHTVASFVPSGQWLRAEINECRLASNGHFYLTLVEKSPDGRGALVAKSNAIIWKNIYSVLSRMFLDATGQCLSPGMSVLVQVNPNFSEAYGFSLYINDIDPTFTLGDLARKRQETIAQLKKDGVWDMNRNLHFPLLPQRVAIISSPTAAGYGDFCKHLHENSNGYVFYTHLFPAIMQGNNAPSSIMEALDCVFQHEELFDVLVIIRGGGDTSDMLAFDDYDLVSCVTQFSLPVITGIGHERDECVLDLVANVPCKTPTAVADYLVNCLRKADEKLGDAIATIKQCSQSVFDKEKSRFDDCVVALTKIPRLLEDTSNHLNDCVSKLKLSTTNLLHEEKVRNDQIANSLYRQVSQTIIVAEGRLNKSAQLLPSLVHNYLEREDNHLTLIEQRVNLQSPQRLLDKGYSMTLLNGKVLKDVSLVQPGDHVEVRISNGLFKTVVEKVEKKQI